MKWGRKRCVGGDKREFLPDSAAALPGKAGEENDIHRLSTVILTKVRIQGARRNRGRRAGGFKQAAAAAAPHPGSAHLLPGRGEGVFRLCAFTHFIVIPVGRTPR